MRNADISDHTARIDLMFPMHEQTVGIGDGGNEIGMGNIRQGVLESQTLVTYPAVATVNELIISSVSNWGGYGLLAALSIQTKDALLRVKTSRSIAYQNVGGSNVPPKIPTLYLFFIFFFKIIFLSVPFLLKCTYKL